MRHWFKFLLFLGGITLVAACNKSDDAHVWPLLTDCDLHQQRCVSRQEQAAVHLQITPHPIPIAKPLQVEAQLDHLSAEQVELDISGINMYMGYNRVTLQRDETNPALFRGTTMLAFCTNEVMQWQITLLIRQADGKLLQVPYQLETRNR